MKIVAGLGNPGAEYVRTPHNVGFAVVERLAERLEGAWRGSPRFQARLAKVDASGARLLLAMPQTYMNVSGSSVAPLLSYHGGGLNDLLVVLDDADLPAGRLRVRASGGSGGHRGLASLIEALGGGDFARVRVGVGRGRQGSGLVEHVLGRLDPEREALVRQTVEKAADAVLCWAAQGVTEAMNRYNGWLAEEAEPPAEG